LLNPLSSLHTNSLLYDKTMENIIASRKLIGIDARGNEFDIEIKIGVPNQTGEHD